MDLRSRARQAGIEPDFIDVQGHLHSADPGVLETLLEIIPPPAPHCFFPDPLIVRPGASTLDLPDQVQLPATWELSCDGAERLDRGKATGRQLKWSVDLAPGVYRFRLVDASGAGDATSLIVAPAAADDGHFNRVWILAVQLYSLRSASNWGIGDFADLMAMIRIAGGIGAAGVGLNPLHVLFDDYPADCSPYAPNSRLFLNPIYIDMAHVPGLPAHVLSDAASRLEQLRDDDLVDYAAVADLKWGALRIAFDKFSEDGDPADRDAFEAFRVGSGRVLRRFACFEALRHQFQAPWWEWPEEWRRPNDEGLDRLARGPAAAEIGYVEFVQWIADRQLQQCTALARDLKMPIGLYLDVAVGVKAGGFDAWNEQGAISRHASVGAPPDPLNTAGQNWGLAGFNASGLEHAMFRPFREMLGASMRYAGAIRLDHVLGLQRVFLVPSGLSAQAGVYVRMPFSALLAITALESQSHGCVVVGEDLGTVPEGFRDRLADSGLWSYRVMLFERNWDGTFKPPDAYLANALATFNTHDLPTFAGWCRGHDLAVKRSIGIDPGETDAERAGAIAALRAAVGEGADADPRFADVVGFLGRTPSRILAIAIEDIVGAREQPNIPGTVDEHPNWRRKLPVSIEALSASDDVRAFGKLLEPRRSTDTWL